MFTGIIEEIGHIASVQSQGTASMSMQILASKVLADVKVGDSIAVNGVCLTVTSFTRGQFTVDVMPETMKSTNLGQLRYHDPVNLERAMLSQSRFGGHMVSGHVDATGEIARKRQAENAILVDIVCGPAMRKYLVPKGSVAVDGISLTIVQTTEQGFSVSIIPHTLQETVLQFKNVGDTVNLEADMLAKYLLHFLQNQSPVAPTETMSRQFLKDHGFI